jgi:molybdate transport system substrate-binding protein
MPRLPVHPLRRQVLLGAMTFALLASLSSGSRAAELLVSAAASLSNAFKELAPAFEAQHPGLVLRFNFAASDALLAQISHGAPVDVFASADQETMDRAEAQKLLVAGARSNFASNTLVLVVPMGAGSSVAGLADLARPEVKRIVLGKPEGVPAGRYARGALDAAKLWPAVEPKAVYANNVRQALDYVARGEVDAGFVYASDAAVQKDRVVVVATVPTVVRISYPVAVVAGGPNAAVGPRFVDYLRSPAAQAVLARHGFGRP